MLLHDSELIVGADTGGALWKSRIGSPSFHNQFTWTIPRVNDNPPGFGLPKKNLLHIKEASLYLEQSRGDANRQNPPVTVTVGPQ
jgi:hypothetical protein